MSEVKIVNILLSSLLLMTIVMFSWTFVYINKIGTLNNYNTPVVSAFNAWTTYKHTVHNDTNQRPFVLKKTSGFWFKN